MSKFRAYDPDQVWLLPPSVGEVLGDQHLSLFVHRIVERLDTSAIESEYSNEGKPAYAPKMMLKLWLYAYALGVTSSRRLEQRIREDLGFRYLAGGCEPDFWTLNAFRKRHPRALNNIFTQVLEWAREQGMARLGHVAIDSTRIAANASRDRIATEEQLRRKRAELRRKIRSWQKQCDGEAQQEAAGTRVEIDRLEERLQQIPGQLKRLRKSGLKKQSITDPDSRFLRERRGFVLGYTADIAVSEDHFIVAQRVTQQAHDSGSLTPMTEQVGRRCGKKPDLVTADCGFYQTEQIKGLQDQSLAVYVPDSNLAAELNGGPPAEQTDGCVKSRSELTQAMRAKLRSPEGRAVYNKRRALVEPVFGVLKEQRQCRRFRLRGLEKVGIEFCFMALAFNVARLFQCAIPSKP